MRLTSRDLQPGGRLRHHRRVAQGRPSTPFAVHVDRHGADWEILPPSPDSDAHLTCETLEEARRVAYLCVAHRRPCTLIVRDEDDHVHSELIGADLGEV